MHLGWPVLAAWLWTVGWVGLCFTCPSDDPGQESKREQVQPALRPVLSPPLSGSTGWQRYCLYKQRSQSPVPGTWRFLRPFQGVHEVLPFPTTYLHKAKYFSYPSIKTYGCPLISAGDWFQDPQGYQTLNAEVPYVK